MKPILAWHCGTEKLGHDDGRRVRYGVRQRFRGGNEIVLCGCGMHASPDILQSLHWSRGPFLRRVELSGKMIFTPDQICAEYRKPLWGFDATSLLRRFARRCALDVAPLWGAPEVVKHFLRTDKKQLWNAAGNAIHDADDAGNAGGTLERESAREAAWMVWAAGDTWHLPVWEVVAEVLRLTQDMARPIQAKQRRRALAMIYREKRKQKGNLR